ncbi:MAG: hypothetical protein EOM06_03100 [Sphingobacteriia bacterium]|nr:hypothetical protein [Sphingobacteriia bacterium]
MKKEELISSASVLMQPGSKSLEEFTRKADILIAELNKRFENREDIQQLIGSGNINMMFDNHRNHFRFMISLFHRYEPEVFVETIAWVFRSYRSHGFSFTYWPALFNTLADILKNNLSADCFNEVYPFYNWMIVNIPAFVSLTSQADFDGTTGNPAG